jgi:hypothetical protein
VEPMYSSLPPLYPDSPTAFHGNSGAGWPLSQVDGEFGGSPGPQDRSNRWAWWVVGLIEAVVTSVARLFNRTVPGRGVSLEVLGRMYQNRQIELLAQAGEHTTPDC